MNNLRVWPHLTIVAIVCALAAGLGVGLYMKHEQTASAAALPDAAAPLTAYRSMLCPPDDRRQVEGCTLKT